MATPFQVVMDCADPAALAAFWADALGYVVQPPPEGYETWDAFLDQMGVPEADRNKASAIVDPDGVGARVFFQRVPEAKVVKNRVHLDVNAGGPPGTEEQARLAAIDAAVDRLIGAGASIVERRTGDFGERFVVMQDPEGNEFCVQ
jgi:catechol 2,3-dioxygenase-like lactoylglutathione lyase family enzyme